MDAKEKLRSELKARKDFCVEAITTYNRKLPKKLLIAFAICLVYSFVRIEVNPEETVSFFTTLLLMNLLFFIIIVVEHFRLLYRIKKDIKEVDDQMMTL